MPQDIYSNVKICPEHIVAVYNVPNEQHILMFMTLKTHKDPLELSTTNQ